MKYIKDFKFFYKYIGKAIFTGLALSFLVGFLGGLGLTMFLPLLQVVGGDSTINTAELGRLEVVLDFLQNSGVTLTIATVLIFMVLFFFS